MRRDKKILIIDGMSCDHCKNAVEKAVSQLPGILLATVDLKAKTLTVEFTSGQLTLDEIKAAVTEEGYEVVGSK